MPSSAGSSGNGLQEALLHHQAGRLAEAEAIYRKILKQQPRDVAALQMLGIVALQTHHHDAAGDFLRRALALQPRNPELHANLGAVLRAQGKPEEAVASFERALALQPDHPGFLNNLGNALRSQNKLDEAAAAYRRALTLKPDHVEAHNNLGNCLREQGRVAEAIDAYRRALAFNARHADVLYHLAGALRQAGQLHEAIACYRNALAVKPDWPQALFELGLVLAEAGSLDDAIAAYQEAVALKPDHAAACYNLAGLLRDRGQLDEAIALYERSVRLEPAFIDALNNLGTALKDAARLSEAAASYRRALALRPDNREALDNLIYLSLFDPGCDQPAVLKELRRWNSLHAAQIRKPLAPSPATETLKRESAPVTMTSTRLKVGYVSADLRDHVVGRNLLPVLAARDRSLTEVVCYADVAKPDEVSRELINASDRWECVSGMSDDAVAERIARDRVDVLIDATLHMAHNRLRVFAHQPARAQVTWLGYPGSTGLTTVQYRLTDPYLDPPGLNDGYYSEKSYRLPDSFWCYSPLGIELPVGASPSDRAGHITFGCLNNFCKINEGVLRCWASVLNRLENSRLLLLAPAGSAREWVQKTMARAGIDARRLTFAAPQPRLSYMRLYHQIDICLDTYPYNGHTTSLDALWMGVPVITRYGEAAVSRAGLSQLSNLKLTEWASGTDEQFQERAVALAADRDGLRALREELRRRMESSPLMNARQFAKNLDAAYLAIWNACQNSPGDRI